MKILISLVLAVSAITAIVLSNTTPDDRSLDSMRDLIFAEMLSISETYNASRPEQMLRDAEWEVSHQRILAADKAANQIQ